MANYSVQQYEGGFWQCGKCAGTEPDWSKECSQCGEKPILHLTGKCGPCTFDEPETKGGNW